MFGYLRDRFWNAIKWSPDRSQIAYLLPFDGRQYLTPLSRRETVRMVEGLAQEFGIIKDGFRGIARHVVGKGLELQLNTEQLDWNEEGELQFEEYFVTPGRFDIAGVRNGYDGQHTGVEQRIFRGEFFVAPTINPRDPWKGEPCWQFFDTNEIGTPDDEEEAGETRIFDGVKLDENNHRLGYYVQTAGGSRFIPAESMVHWFQPTGINQTRGESDFAPVINRLVDWKDLETLFTKHAKTHSTVAIALKKLARIGQRGMMGAVKRHAPGGSETTEPGVDTRALEKAFPGMIAYLGENGEAQLLNSTSPSESLAKFITDVLAPNVFASLGIAPEFFWQVTRAGGPTQRFILSRADLLFQILADKLACVWLNAVAFRFLSHRIRIGRLPAPKDPNWASKMSWGTPAKLSIDRGDRQLAIEELHNGRTNLRRCYDGDGLRWREETRQWIREFVVFEQLCNEEGLPPEKIAALLLRWRPPKPGVVMPGADTAEPDPAAPDPAPPGKAGYRGGGGDSRGLADGRASAAAIDQLVCQLSATRKQLRSLSN